MKTTSLKPFLILWSTQAISQLGSSLTSYALILWVYQQKGTVSSIAGLSIATYLPSILFCFAAGTIADKWNKKIIMLCSDAIAALGTLTIMLLYLQGQLQIGHLYVVNLLISFMDAFQSPASYVATSLLVPKHHYAKASALQSFSSSFVRIFTPAFATALLSFTNLTTIFVIDILTFLFAFLTLAIFIKIPVLLATEKESEESFFKRCRTGIDFLLKHRALLELILFFSFINLLASMSDNSLLPALILGKTNNDTQILGYVSATIGIGAMVGSIAATFARTPKSRTRVIFISCAMSCLCFGIPLALFSNMCIWIAAAFLANFPLPFLNANMTTLMRQHVPITLQGRVFAVRDTLQFITIPLGLALGACLSDHLFEPWMATDNIFSALFAPFVGTGKGTGIAIIFLCTAIIGGFVSLCALRSKRLRSLDK